MCQDANTTARNGSKKRAIVPQPGDDTHGRRGLADAVRRSVDSAAFLSRHRDIHAVGIVLMQMLLGLDVTQRFDDPQSAIRACELGLLPQHCD